MPGLSSEHMEILMNEIVKVRLDTKEQKLLEKIPLERLVQSYIEMSVEIIKKMEKCRDPVFMKVLEYAKALLTQKEFLSIQIEVYAACNIIAMQQFTPVDEIAHLVNVQDHYP